MLLFVEEKKKVEEKDGWMYINFIRDVLYVGIVNVRKR